MYSCHFDNAADIGMNLQRNSKHCSPVVMDSLTLL